MPESPSRIRAAILFTDIAGYTAMMQRDEAGTLALLEKFRQALSSLLDRYDGRLVKDLGDGQLCIFEEVENAVFSAIELQKLARKEIQLPLRAGMHWGEVTIKGQDIFGSAVNLASRIESFSAPGTVLVSSDIYQSLRNHSFFDFHRLGNFSLKHVKEEVTLYAVANEGMVIPDPTELSGKGQKSLSTNNLPRPLTSFLGREKETKEIKHLLRTNRLVTLTGPGGTGKTRLALRVAQSIKSGFDNTLCWVELAPVADPTQVPFAIAQALGAEQDITRDIEEILLQYLQDKELLLLLDNFEQVVDAAPLIKQMLERCPDVKVLVTSRVPLGIISEQEYPVEPLPLPDLSTPASISQLKEVPSVDLFVQRAQTVNPRLKLNTGNASVIAQVCIRLDGLPLAIELAAARIKIFPPKTLLKRLSSSLNLLKMEHRDLPSRHQTLRQTIAWSYDLLDDEEKRLLQRLSVFVGGGTLEAIEEICGQQTETNWDVISKLLALVNKSLVRMEEKGEEPRYYMLETIREFARELLEKAAKSTAMRENHAHYFLRLAERAYPHLTEGAQRYWLTILEEEHLNLRAAIEWCVANDKIEWANRLGIALWRFWVGRNHLLEGKQIVESLLKQPLPGEDPSLRLKLLHGLGGLYMNITDFKEAVPIFREILKKWESLGNEEEIAANQNNLGWSLMFSGKGEEAEALTLQALEYYESNHDPRGMCRSYNNLGGLYLYLYGDPHKGIPFFEKSLTIRRKLGDERGVGFAKTLLAWCYARIGKHEKARLLVTESMRLNRARNDRYLISTGLLLIGELCINSLDKGGLIDTVEELEIHTGAMGYIPGLNAKKSFLKSMVKAGGAIEEADAVIAESLKVMEEHSVIIHCFPVRHFRGVIWLEQQKYEQALRLFREALHIFKKYHNLIFFTDSLELIIAIFVEKGHLRAAGRLLGKAAALRQELNAVAPPLNQPYLDRAAEHLRNELSEAETNALFEEGKKLSLHEVVEAVSQSL